MFRHQWESASGTVGESRVERAAGGTADPVRVFAATFGAETTADRIAHLADQRDGQLTGERSLARRQQIMDKI